MHPGPRERPRLRNQVGTSPNPSDSVRRIRRRWKLLPWAAVPEFPPFSRRSHCLSMDGMRTFPDAMHERPGLFPRPKKISFVGASNCPGSRARASIHSDRSYIVPARAALRLDTADAMADTRAPSDSVEGGS